MRITITHLRDSRAVPAAQVRQWARRFAARLRAEGNLHLAELSVAFVDDAEMTRINWQFLRHRGSTDVITFSYPTVSDRKGGVGEIVICVPRARQQARQFRRPLAEELARYLAHGLLHLAGKDDKSPALCRAIHKAENQLLAELGKSKPS